MQQSIDSRRYWTIKFIIRLVFRISILLGLGCSGKHYFRKQESKILEKYPLWKIQKRNAPIPNISRSEAKKQLNLMEKTFALSPDTLKIINNTRIFIYTNKNKINYIKKHHLKTQEMRFDSHE